MRLYSYTIPFMMRFVPHTSIVPNILDIKNVILEERKREGGVKRFIPIVISLFLPIIISHLSGM